MAQWVQLSASKRRFLIQSPEECAQTLKRAFADPKTPITGEAYAAQMRRDHPMPPEFGREPDQTPAEPPDV